MAKIWCPYTGQEWDEGQTSPEHIIPLALCGADNFVVPVNASVNNELGTSIDGKFAQNNIVMFARTKYDCHGHRKRLLSNRLKSEIDGWPGKIEFTRDGILLKGYRDLHSAGLHTDINPTKGQEITSTIALPVDVSLSFGAKVALSAATYFFGDSFRKYGYHTELRQLLDVTNCVEWLREYSIKHGLTNGPTSYFWAVPWPKSIAAHRYLPAWTTAIHMWDHKHIIWTHYTASEVVLCICLFSSFIWYFNISDQPDKFTSNDEYDIGIALEINLNERKKKAVQGSLRSYLMAIQQNLRQPNSK